MELTFPLILDGATGTELEKHGYPGGVSAEAWTLDHPEAILDIQRGYVDAGSRVLYSPTFGANRVKLEAHGIFNQVADFNRRLVALSREAAVGRAYVAGDIAPTGLFLYPLGETTFDEFVDIYTEQARALEDAGVDLFVIETMMTLAEARAALLAVRSVSAKPVFVTFTCDEQGKTLTGTDVAVALEIMQGMGADAFGLNCSAGPWEIAAQLKRLRALARVPLIAKPNAGRPAVVDGKTVFSLPPEEFAARADDMALAGAMIFGGCCGTTAAHIRALAAETAKLPMHPPAPKNTDLLPCATEKEAFFLDPAVAVGSVLRCDARLEDALEDALESDEALVTVEIARAEELDDFAACQHLITKPLCLRCADAALLEQALRLYQGRALYDGPLGEDALRPLAAKYGVLF